MKTNKKQCFAWKVVCHDNKLNILTSAIVHYTKTVTYNLNQWSYPPKNGESVLFVFNTRQNARNFAQLQSPYPYNTYTIKPFRIYKCEIKGNLTKPSEHPFFGKVLRMGTQFPMTWPPGTLLTTAVKLLPPLKLKTYMLCHNCFNADISHAHAPIRTGG